MKMLNDDRSKETQSWTLPGSSVELTSQIDSNPLNSKFYFSANTVAKAADMYEQIGQQILKLDGRSYVTTTFYQDFIHTPGHLFPPKWYLMLPSGFRGLIETELLLGETLFQICELYFLDCLGDVSDMSEMGFMFVEEVISTATSRNGTCRTFAFNGDLSHSHSGPCQTRPKWDSCS